MAHCPVCARTEAVPLLDLGAAAVFCNVQWATRNEALAAARGPIELVACSQCGHVFNAAFDSGLIAYSPGYENSQHASTVFAGYAEALVDRLVRTYELEGSSIVDIGCGRGDLLRMLVARAGGAGYGFDPSYHGSEGGADDAVRIVREYFDAPHARDLQPGLVCCRHVLEHVPDPVVFLTQMREALAAAGDPVLYLEVPNGTHLFRTGCVWDVLYEHYSYFSAHSLELALLKSGFEVLNLYEDFGSQFLCVDARVARSADRPRLAQLEETVSAVPTDSAGRMSGRISRWKSWAAERSGASRATVWGAGSKGVMFLNLIGIRADGLIDSVIDQNPAKNGRFVSGTGQRIALPSAEALRSVDEIVLMNSIYAGEVQARVRAMGSAAELLFADAELAKRT
jgi:SAM-dependent methyltransferase